MRDVTVQPGLGQLRQLELPFHVGLTMQSKPKRQPGKQMTRQPSTMDVRVEPNQKQLAFLFF